MVTMAKTKTAVAFDVLRSRRVTDDGRACIDVAERLFTSAPKGAQKLESIAEARQWVKLGLDHDRAKDSKLLHELRELLAEKTRRAAKLNRMREGGHLKVVPDGTS
jgi:hypothetical protein